MRISFTSNPNQSSHLNRTIFLLCQKLLVHFHLNRRLKFQRWYKKKSLTPTFSSSIVALLKTFLSKAPSKRLLSQSPNLLSLCLTRRLFHAECGRSQKMQISGFFQFLSLITFFPAKSSSACKTQDPKCEENWKQRQTAGRTD